MAIKTLEFVDEWGKLCEEEDCEHSNMDVAARYGHLEIVKYLHSKGFECTTDAMDWAAGNGHLAVVKYLHFNGFECTTRAINVAAGRGYVDVVVFLVYNRKEGCTDDAMFWAIKHGHLDVIKFLNDVLKIPVMKGFTVYNGILNDQETIEFNEYLTTLN